MKTIPPPQSQGSTPSKKRIGQIVILFIWLATLFSPAYIFFSERSGVTFINEIPFTKSAQRLFPLFGLYALFFVWTQVILGSLMPIWQRLWSNIFYFHRAEGIFALLFATAHPLLLAFGVGLDHYFARDFVLPNQIKFIFFGYATLFTMYLTISAALLMNKKFMLRWWRKIHIVNYLVFFFAWIHSWNLGTDIQTTNLKYLWWWFGASCVSALLVRVISLRRR